MPSQPSTGSRCTFTCPLIFLFLVQFFYPLASRSTWIYSGEGGEGSDGSKDGSDEEDGIERDPLEAMVAAFEADEYHVLPLEMKVQALEYLVDRAMEVSFFIGASITWNR